MKWKALVRCSYVVEVEMELPDDRTEDDVRQIIEEKNCPATGDVGNALDAALENEEKTGDCWACELNGKNEIIKLEKLEE